MRFTLFGILWILYLIYCFFSNDHRRMLFAALFSMVLQCNNILYIGQTGIGAQIFTICVAWVRLWLVKPSGIQVRKLKKLGLLAVGLLGAVILSLIASGFWYSSHVIAVAMIAVYAAFLLTLSGKRMRADDAWLERAENRILIFVLVIGVLQVLCKSGVHILTRPLQLLIYNDVNNSDVIFSWKDVDRFYSTFMEPSYCGAYLVGMFALIMVRRKLTAGNLALGIAVCAAIILTRSSTAYGGLVIIGSLLLITRARKKVFRFLVPAFLLGGLSLFAFNMELMNEVIFEKAETGSFATRANLDEIAMASFMANPLFGAGYRNIRASSLFYSLLGEVGLTGFLIFLALTLLVVKWAVFDRDNPSAKGRSYFVLGVIICQFIACPDLNLSPFWMALYCLALSLQIDARSHQEGALKKT